MSQLLHNTPPLHSHQEYHRACEVLVILEHEWLDKYMTRSDENLKWAAKEIAELRCRINTFAGNSHVAQADFNTTISNPKVTQNLLDITIREWQHK